MRKTVVCCSLAVLVACSNAPPGEAPDETRTDVAPKTDLVTSLEVEVGAGTVRFVLHMTNPTSQPITLEFASAQRYDFVVQKADGTEVWRWAADQMFAQMLSEETIPANASRDYSAVWTPGNQSGAFIAIGRITAIGRKIEQRAEFVIQQR